MNDKALLEQAKAIAEAIVSTCDYASPEVNAMACMADSPLVDAARDFLAALSQQEAAPSVPMFDSLSNDDGYSWYENPADAELIFGVLGNSAKVGDEFEVTAGWNSTTAKYRITKASTGDDFEVDEFEVECISHKEFRAEAAPVAPSAEPAPLVSEPIGYTSQKCLESSMPNPLCHVKGFIYKSPRPDSQMALYTHPQPAPALSEPTVKDSLQVALSDEQIESLFENNVLMLVSNKKEVTTLGVVKFGRALIEAAIKGAK